MRIEDNNYDYILYEFKSGALSNGKLSTNNYGKDWKIPLTAPSQFIYVGERVIFYQKYLDTLYTLENGRLLPYLTVKSSEGLTNEDLKAVSNLSATSIETTLKFHNLEGLNGPYRFLENKCMMILEFRKESEQRIILRNKFSGDVVKTNYINFTDDMHDLISFNSFIYANENYLVRIKTIKGSNQNPLLVFYLTKDLWDFE